MNTSGSSTGNRSKNYIDGLLAGLTFGDHKMARPSSKVRKRKAHIKIDVLLLLAVITLLIIGLIMVYSASYDYSLSWYGDHTTIFMRQIVFLGIGLVCAVLMAIFDYQSWSRFVVLAMLVTIGLLALVLVINDVRNGAIRTLYEGSIQPSELAKLMTVVYLAVWLYAKRDSLNDLGFGLIPLAVILGLVAGLIALQPDISAVITVMILGGLLFFLAGGETRQILALILIALVVGYLVIIVSSTGSQRVSDYIAGLKDPTQGSYHVRRSFEAFVKGGWFGVGIGNADTKLTGLPVPHTDSIFAVVGEETGVIGTTILVSMYVVLLWRGISIAQRAPDQLGSLLAMGLTLWLCIEAFINMAVMVNLLPFAGNALPLISSGGSSLVMSLVAIGILINISRQSERSEEENDRFFNAVINMRWRDRGRRLSSDRRSSSSKRPRSSR